MFSGCATTTNNTNLTKDTLTSEQKAYIEEKKSKEKIAEEEYLQSQKNITNLSKREQIVKIAMGYLNKKDGGDCSGFVNLVNIKNNSPFYQEKELSNSFDNARKSRAMYNLMKKKGNAFDNALPHIGDLVFFEDTEHRASSKTKTNAKSKTKTKVVPAPKSVAENITHVGIVTRVDSDKTIEFIHHSNGKNIVDYMNTQYATQTQRNGKVVNTYMKRCPSKNGAVQTSCLNLAFFVAYGTF